MGIFDLFSKRQKRLRGDVPDVYTYDSLPNPLRVQVIHIWEDSIGGGELYCYNPEVKKAYKYITDILCREYGLFKLPTAEEFGERNYLTELANFLLKEQDVERQLDVIELSFKVINHITRNIRYRHEHHFNERADNAIKELNKRFKEHGIGYQFIDDEIIRVDSELVHAEVVKPALRLLNGKDYSGAQQEFLSSYEHYRHGKHKEALNECLKAFESTMKAICDKRGWTYQKNATARSLIQICFENGLIPSFWQQQMTSLKSLLESSVPTARNKLSGHGQGNEIIEVPEYLVSYMLHMTASTIVFLVNAEQNIA
ncbi:STM4504/CBY_0614 family protein [Vibrio atypicus]|uniref:STM4504/CBY_0614 family protein n=1 Tax=Vibrio atypicus TaxID=558271 RepID=UPI0037352B9A